MGCPLSKRYSDHEGVPNQKILDQALENYTTLKALKRVFQTEIDSIQTEIKKEEATLLNLLDGRASNRREQLNTAATIARLNVKMQALSNGIQNLQQLINDENKSSAKASFTNLMASAESIERIFFAIKVCEDEIPQVLTKTFEMMISEKYGVLALIDFGRLNKIDSDEKQIAMGTYRFSDDQLEAILNEFKQKNGIAGENKPKKSQEKSQVEAPERKRYSIGDSTAPVRLTPNQWRLKNQQNDRPKPIKFSSSDDDAMFQSLPQKKQKQTNTGEPLANTTMSMKNENNQPSQNSELMNRTEKKPDQPQNQQPYQSPQQQPYQPKQQQQPMPLTTQSKSNEPLFSGDILRGGERLLSDGLLKSVAVKSITPNNSNGIIASSENEFSNAIENALDLMQRSNALRKQIEDLANQRNALLKSLSALDESKSKDPILNPIPTENTKDSPKYPSFGVSSKESTLLRPIPLGPTKNLQQVYLVKDMNDLVAKKPEIPAYPNQGYSRDAFYEIKINNRDEFLQKKNLMDEEKKRSQQNAQKNGQMQLELDGQLAKKLQEEEFAELTKINNANALLLKKQIEEEQKKRSQQNAEKKGLTLAELTQKFEREMQEKIDRSKELAKNIQEKINQKKEENNKREESQNRIQLAQSEINFKPSFPPGVVPSKPFDRMMEESAVQYPKLSKPVDPFKFVPSNNPVDKILEESALSTYDNFFDEAAVKNLRTLRDKLVRENRKFEDAEFPPNLISTIAYNTNLWLGLEQLAWRRLDKEFKPNLCLFDKIEPSVAKQGQLGNCWFMSSLSALSERPQFLKRLIFPNMLCDRGLYQVTLWDSGEMKSIVIDNYVPVYKGSTSLAFASHENDQGIWVPLLEKAFAKMYGSYQAIGGGDPAEGLAALTGAPTERLNLKDIGKNAQVVWEYLANVIQNGYISTVSAGNMSEKDLTVSIMDKRVVENHAYTLLGIVEVRLEDGSTERLIKLRNPWAQIDTSFDDWGAKSKRWTLHVKSQVAQPDLDVPGVIWVTLDKFSRRYAHLCICKIVSRFKHSFIKIDTKSQLHPSNNLIVKFAINRQMEACISVHQKDQRHFKAKNTSYNYSPIRATIIQIDPITCAPIKIIGGDFHIKRTLSFERLFEEGHYVMIIEAFWTQSFYQSIVVCSYSEEKIKFEDFGQYKYQIPSILAKASYLYLGEKLKKEDLSNVKVRKYLNDIQMCSLSDMGLYVLYFENFSKNVIMTFELDFSSSIGYEVLYPDSKARSLKLDFELGTNEEYLVVLKSTKNPSSLSMGTSSKLRIKY